MASSQLSRRPVRRAVRVWGSARVAEAGITADEERRLRTRGLPEVAGIASLTKSEAKRDTREIEKAAHWLGASGGGRAGGAGGPRRRLVGGGRHRGQPQNLRNEGKITNVLFLFSCKNILNVIFALHVFIRKPSKILEKPST